MLERVINKLNDLGYTVLATEADAVARTLDSVIDDVKNYCGRISVITAMEPAVVDLTVGRFLHEKKLTDINSLSAFDTSAAIAQISEGDTSVSYVTGEAGSSLDMLIARLVYSGKDRLNAWRCISW